VKISHYNTIVPASAPIGLLDLPDGAEVNWHLFKAWQRQLFRAANQRKPWLYIPLSEYLQQYEARERARRVRAFGRKRRLLRALWPLRQIKTGMEGKRQKPWLDNPNWVLAEARRRRDERV